MKTKAEIMRRQAGQRTHQLTKITEENVRRYVSRAMRMSHEGWVLLSIQTISGSGPFEGLFVRNPEFIRGDCIEAQNENFTGQKPRRVRVPLDDIRYMEISYCVAGTMPTFMRSYDAVIKPTERFFQNFGGMDQRGPSFTAV
jgi:hypothetical protein